MIARGIAGAALLAIVSGCSTTTVKLEDGNTLVTDATNRVVVSSKNAKGERIVCAEPSPDAMASVALAAAATAKIPSANVDAGAQGSYARNVAALGLRTASIQILRDLGYRACEGVMNNVIDGKIYEVMVGGVTDATLGLVAIEGLTQMPAAPTIVTNASASTTPGPNGVTTAANPGTATVQPVAAGTSTNTNTGDVSTVAASVVQIIHAHYEVRKEQMKLMATKP